MIAVRVHLWQALFAAYESPYALAALLKLVQDILLFLQAQLLRVLLAYISKYQRARDFAEGERPSWLEGFAIALVMSSFSLVYTFNSAYRRRIPIESSNRHPLHAKPLISADMKYVRVGTRCFGTELVPISTVKRACANGITFTTTLVRLVRRSEIKNQDVASHDASSKLCYEFCFYLALSSGHSVLSKTCSDISETRLCMRGGTEAETRATKRATCAEARL